MSIDGINRPPPAGGATPLGGPLGAEQKGESFRVGRESDVGATAPTAGLLGQLERGELSFEQYLDARVNEATAPFEGRLRAEQLEFVRESLRAQLETDPVLVDLVRRTADVGASTRDP